MKVYLTPPQPSRGLQRIADALTPYKPDGVEVVDTPTDADLTIIYAIGRRDQIQRLVDHLRSRGKKYAVIQVCLRSTMSPSTLDWWFIWATAEVVWSYYDLQKALADEDPEGLRVFDNFYHAPLGANSEVFRLQPAMRDYVILSSGSNRLQESVRECYLAAQSVGLESAHLGRDLGKPGVHCYAGISDDTLRWLYNKTQFVSGLRRTEGFELPAVEGLLCGARPIVFDTPDYHWNYGDHAEYIHEGTRAEVVDQLVQLFKQGARPVTAHEREEAAHWFNWERICGEFWSRCL